MLEQNFGLFPKKYIDKCKLWSKFEVFSQRLQWISQISIFQQSFENFRKVNKNVTTRMEK